MYKNLEHHEHAEHIAHQAAGHAGEAPEDARESARTHGNQLAALLVAVLAAGLAVTEQGGKHAEIRVQENAVFATDAWAQYQAKSTRATLARDISDLVAVIEPTDPTVMERRRALVARLDHDQTRYEKDPRDGKTAIAERARAFETARDHALEETHSYHNGAAAMELGIVLSTASAITRARLLLLMAAGLGIIGGAFALLGFIAPEYGAI
jgi:Domain of unknown function (DUF4337)